MTPATAQEIERWDRDKHRRKITQAWECAGCARVDRDKVDEAAWTKEARRLEQLYREIHTS